MHLFVLAAVVSTATPAQKLDQTWGVLNRSEHLHGSWRIDLDDGTHLGGDWIVVNREPFVARDFGGGGGPAKAIYLVDSKTTTICAFDADNPFWLYCTGGVMPNVKVHAGVTVSLARGSTPLDTYRCQQAPCAFRPGGTIQVDVKPTSPSLAQEELLFERTVGAPIASWLGATARHDAGRLELVMPFRDVTLRPPVTHDKTHYAQEVVEATATIRLGPSATHVEITARETARHVEACVAVTSEFMGCAPMPPSCTRVEREDR